jgi:hypothetical protein
MFFNIVYFIFNINLKKSTFYIYINKYSLKLINLLQTFNFKKN